MSVRAHDRSQSWMAGPDILAHYMYWSVLLLISDCLKIPSHGPMGRAGQTPSFLRGLRVIHLQQSLLVQLGSMKSFVLTCVEPFETVLEASAARMTHLLLVIGLFCDEANISEADI